MTTPYKIGDIIVEVSSYNMTFVYFYQVTGMTKTGKTITYRRVKDETVSSAAGGFSGTVVALPNMFSESEDKAITKRVTSAPKLWDGSAKYFNYLD